MKVIEKQNCKIILKENKDGEIDISVSTNSDDYFISVSSCTTNYNIELIEKILDIKGPAYLCDEIRRDEDPNYVQNHLEKGISSMIKERKGLRILDFGCGSGASSMVLSRIFAQSKILGVELDNNFLNIAKARKIFYNADNIDFILSPSPEELPENIGKFDIIIFSAVFEHLLPAERKKLFPMVFSHLKSDGIFYLDQTPHRYWFVESHTTGLPLINYLPDGIILFLAKNFSKRNFENCDWDDLLRKGVRGGTITEIKRILKSNNYNFELITPHGHKISDHVDLWFSISSHNRVSIIKRFTYFLLKGIYLITGIIFTPSITISIKRID